MFYVWRIPEALLRQEAFSICKAIGREFISWAVQKIGLKAFTWGQCLKPGQTSSCVKFWLSGKFISNFNDFLGIIFKIFNIYIDIGFIHLKFLFLMGKYSWLPKKPFSMDREVGDSIQIGWFTWVEIVPQYQNAICVSSGANLAQIVQCSQNSKAKWCHFIKLQDRESLHICNYFEHRKYQYWQGM